MPSSTLTATLMRRAPVTDAHSSAEDLGPDFDAVLHRRRAVRAFRTDPVPEDLLTEVLDDAAQAPSWSNTRPYMLAIATGERAERIRAAYAAEFDRSAAAQRGDKAAMAKLALTGSMPDGDYKVWAPYPADLRMRSVRLGKALYTHIGLPRGDKAARDAYNRRNGEAFGAPVIGFVLVHSGIMPFAAMDAGLMLQTLFLSATAHGLATCPIGMLAAWRRPIDAEFEVPEEYKLITGFALGYEADEPINAFRAEHDPIGLVPPREG